MSYSTNFHDITSGTSTGNPNYSCGVGYDLVTGIGTPIANVLIPALASYGASGSTATATANSIGSFIAKATTKSKATAAAGCTTRFLAKALKKTTATATADSTGNVFYRNITGTKGTSSANSAVNFIGNSFYKSKATAAAGCVINFIGGGTKHVKATATAGSITSFVGHKTKSVTATATAGSTTKFVGTRILPRSATAMTGSTTRFFGSAIISLTATTTADSTTSFIGSSIDNSTATTTADSTTSFIGNIIVPLSATTTADSDTSFIGSAFAFSDFNSIADSSTNIAGSIIVNCTGTGSLITDGAATISVKKDYTGTGSLITDGAATISVKKDYTGTGLLDTIGGSATILLSLEYIESYFYPGTSFLPSITGLAVVNLQNKYLGTGSLLNFGGFALIGLNSIKINQTVVGNGPYNLITSGVISSPQLYQFNSNINPQLYQLSSNITTPGTTLNISANYIELDLNGYTITYNTEPGDNLSAITSGWNKQFVHITNSAQFVLSGNGGTTLTATTGTFRSDMVGNPVNLNYTTEFTLSGTGNTLTSTSGTFLQSMVGNVIVLNFSGSNLYYKITGVTNGTTATVNPTLDGFEEVGSSFSNITGTVTTYGNYLITAYIDDNNVTVNDTLGTFTNAIGVVGGIIQGAYTSTITSMVWQTTPVIGNLPGGIATITPADPNFIFYPQMVDTGGTWNATNYTYTSASGSGSPVAQPVNAVNSGSYLKFDNGSLGYIASVTGGGTNPWVITVNSTPVSGTFPSSGTTNATAGNSLVVGQTVQVSGVNPSTYNNDFWMVQSITPTSFTVFMPSTNLGTADVSGATVSRSGFYGSVIFSRQGISWEIDHLSIYYQGETMRGINQNGAGDGTQNCNIHDNYVYPNGSKRSGCVPFATPINRGSGYKVGDKVTLNGGVHCNDVLEVGRIDSNGAVLSISNYDLGGCYAYPFYIDPTVGIATSGGSGNGLMLWPSYGATHYDGFVAISIGATGGTCAITNNYVVGNGYGGIGFGYGVPGFNVPPVIQGNTIMMAAPVRDGYAIGVGGAGDFNNTDVSNNIIIQSSGRGIIIAGDVSSTSVGPYRVLCHNNYIEAAEAWDEGEYFAIGDSIQICLRFGQSCVKVYQNTVVGHAGLHAATTPFPMSQGTSGMAIGIKVATGPNSFNNQIYDNNVSVNTTDTGSTVALGLYGDITSDGVTAFYNNTVTSNGYLVSLNSTDGNGSNFVFTSNTFIQNGPLMGYAGCLANIELSYWGIATNNVFIDNTWEGGASGSSIWANSYNGSYPYSLFTKWYLNVTVIDADGDPIPGATVTASTGNVGTPIAISAATETDVTSPSGSLIGNVTVTTLTPDVLAVRRKLYA